MNVCLLVYSQTGNTMSVAQAAVKMLQEAGHTAEIIPVETVGEVKPPEKPEIKPLPDLSGYEAVILASPVQAFSLSAPMSACLATIGGLSGKKVGLFVTQHLKHAWLGGNHAIRQMKAPCQAAGAEVYATGIIHWSSPKREAQIASLCQSLAAL